MAILKERPLHILAADDSAVMRGIMRTLFLRHAEDRRVELPEMELIGVAQDGVECLEAVMQLAPDVLVLDLEMPRMSGLEVLDRLRKIRPDLPVIMCSSYTERGARATLDALARGASDYVMKPAGQREFETALSSLAAQLLPRIAALAAGRRSHSRPDRAMLRSVRRLPSQEGTTVGVDGARHPVEVLVVGVSTGGPAALEQLLPCLAQEFPVPVLIVQHMPKLFTGVLAERLDRCCPLHVEEAYSGAPLKPGTIWLAPGNAHMEVSSQLYRPWGNRSAHSKVGVKLHWQEPLNHCRPSVDYLFQSAAKVYGAGTLAVVLTGMGSDGLNGSRAIHDIGGTVLAQDEATSAVWGMPGRVSEAGIASATLPLTALAREINQRVKALQIASVSLRHAEPHNTRQEVAHGLL